MKLGAYTLIEGVVAMVILSILLSVTVVISFNLYTSFPSEKELFQRSLLDSQLDSLVGEKVTDRLSYLIGHYAIDYNPGEFYDFEYVKVGKCTLTDTSGHVLSAERIFYIPAEDEESD